MKSAKYDLEADENATFKKKFKLRDEYKNIMKLLGYTALMQIRSDDDTLLLELSTENGGLVINEDLGEISIFIEKVLLSYGGVYDLLLFAPSDETYKPIRKSKFRVIEGVTNVE